MARCFAVPLALVATLAGPELASADDGAVKRACVAASEHAQQLRNDGHLAQAREELLACGKAECPALVRHDCAEWMGEVVAATPTVVLGARDGQGRDLLDVVVTVDGAVVTSRLDGKPLPVDPGVHALRFEAPGAGAPIEMRVIARAGEKNRALVATWGPATPGAQGVGVVEPAPSTPREREPAVSPPSRPGIPALAWLLGAAAAAALGTALYFEIAQVSDYNGLAATCGGHCSPQQVSGVNGERWAAGVAAGAGALLLGGAAYVVLARPGDGSVASVGFARAF